jgi:hypothetical protein
MTISIDIKNDFSSKPFGRDENDGKHSGKKFRDEVLLDYFSSSNEEIIVYLDGVDRGYGSSFLEEAFAGLLRAGVSYSDVKSRLTIDTKDEGYKNEIWEYIEDQKNRESSH